MQLRFERLLVLLMLCAAVTAHAQTSTEHVPTYVIQSTVTGNGTIAPVNAAVKQGKNKRFQLTPAAGAWIIRVTLNDADVTPTLKINPKTGKASLIVENVQQHSHINVTFGLDTRPTPQGHVITINQNSPQHGRSSYAQTVKPGKSATIVMDDCDFAGFQEEGVAQVLLDGADVTNQVAIAKCTGRGRLKLANVTTNHVIDYTLAIITPCPTPAPKHDVWANYAKNKGSVAPDKFTLREGKTKTIVFKPNAGYYLSSVYIGNTNVISDVVIDQRGNGYYNYANTHGETIIATFSPAGTPTPTPTPTLSIPTPTPKPTYPITISYTGNGSIMQSGSSAAIPSGTTIQRSGYVTIYYKPATGATLLDAQLDGASVMSKMRYDAYYGYYYSFNVTAAHAIHAIFGQESPTPTPTRTPTRTPTPPLVYHSVTITAEGSNGEVNTGVKKVIDGRALYITWVMYGYEPVSVTLDGVNVMSQVTHDDDGNYEFILNNVTADHAVHINLGSD